MARKIRVFHLSDSIDEKISSELHLVRVVTIPLYGESPFAFLLRAARQNESTNVHIKRHSFLC